MTDTSTAMIDWLAAVVEAFGRDEFPTMTPPKGAPRYVSAADVADALRALVAERDAALRTIAEMREERRTTT